MLDSVLGARDMTIEDKEGSCGSGWGEAGTEAAWMLVPPGAAGAHRKVLTGGGRPGAVSRSGLEEGAWQQGSR